MNQRKFSNLFKARTDYFDDGSIVDNLREKTVRGSAVLIGASIARLSINLISTIILARLLDPEAYGLLAMVLVVTNFISLFQDMNLSLATVQHPEISHSQVSTIYWLNVLLTFVIVAVLLVAAPGITWFFDEPRLELIASLLCISIILRGLGSQHKALLRRKMQFGSIAAIEVLSMFSGYVVAIVLAWNGIGYWSLVWLHIVSAAVSTILSWVFSGWCPGRPIRGAGVREMLVFGGNLTGYTLLRYPAKTLDRAIIGWQMGAAQVGLYSKSYELVGPLTGYVTTPINTVAVSALSRLVDTPPRYRVLFRRLIEATALISLPIVIVIMCSAENIIALLLGPKWLDAGPIFAILGVLVFVETMASGVRWLFISQGRGGHLLQIGAIESLLRIVAILIGLNWGIYGIVISIVAISLFAQLPLQVWYACRTGPVRMSLFYRAIFPVVMASAIGFGATLWVRFWFPSESPIIGLAQSLLTVGFIILVMLIITPSGRDLFREIYRHLPLIFKYRQS
jgi:O-antigen/teichoic acid export membrane protein